MAWHSSKYRYLTGLSGFGSSRHSQWLFIHFVLLVWGAARATAQMPAAPTPDSSPPVPALSLSGPGPNGVLSSFDSESGMQIDVLFGKIGVSSYTLSWKNPRFNSDLVVCDGRKMQRDNEYTLDYAGGSIQFSHALAAGTMVRVSYSIDSLSATRNGSAGTAPLYWDLWQKGANRLRLRMLDRDDTYTSSSLDPYANDYGRNALQWTGNTRLLHGPAWNAQLDTKLFMDLQGGDLLEHGGFGVAERTHWGKTDFGLSYSRAGALFTQSQESGLAAGQANLAAKVSITPSKGLIVSSEIKQTTTQSVSDTAASSSAALPVLSTVSTQANVSLAAEVAALQKTKLSATVSQRNDKDGEHRSGEALVQLPRLPLGQTQFSGGVQIATDPGQERLVGILSATTHPVRYLEVAGDARLRNSLLADDRLDPNAINTYGVKVNFSPSKRFRLTGNILMNPEEEGSVKRLQRNAFGLQTDWGQLAVHSQVGVDQDYTTTRFSDMSEMGVDYHLTRSDTFTTGFREHNFFDRTTPGTYSYLIGFKRRLGSSVDLILNGSYTQSTNSADAIRPELKTEAKVGLKF